MTLHLARLAEYKPLHQCIEFSTCHHSVSWYLTEATLVQGLLHVLSWVVLCCVVLVWPVWVHALCESGAVHQEMLWASTMRAIGLLSARQCCDSRFGLSSILVSLIFPAYHHCVSGMSTKATRVTWLLRRLCCLALLCVVLVWISWSHCLDEAGAVHYEMLGVATSKTFGLLQV